MPKKLLALLVVSVTVLLLPGCSFSSHPYSFESSTTIRGGLPSCATGMEVRLKNVHLAQPTVGLFIGVSHYDSSSKLELTPAHTISAAMFREPFYVTAPPVSLREDLFLVTDLRLDPRTEIARATDYALNQIEGVRDDFELMNDFWKNNLNDDGTLSYIRNGEPVTRRRILKSLVGALARAEEVARQRNSVLFLLYVSSHGWIASDGKSYVLPTDADYRDQRTWIGYEEFLRPIAEFVSRTESDRHRRQAIVVFDSCRKSRDESPVLEGASCDAENVPIPSAISSPSFDLAIDEIFVTTTSPGDYSWHWIAETEFKEDRKVSNERRWGFPFPPPKAKRGHSETKLSSKMSVTPLASNCAISLWFKNAGSPRAKMPGDREEDEILEILQGREDHYMGALEWLLKTSTILGDAVNSIKDAKSVCAKQEMQILSKELLVYRDIPLFEFDAHNVDSKDSAP